MNGSDPKLSARELLEEAHPQLVGLSHWIHANPEVGYEEVLASGWVAEWLTTGGFEVETGVAGMPTAVVGRTGPGPLHVAICVEYDALPEVGHACGHNVIAAASVGAGLALASVAEELGLRVTVLGTPAEETGGGKLRLIEAGAFDGVHAAMMVHPWPTDVATPSIIAVNQLEVTYTGREAHAAGFPQRGRNAADALVIAQTAIGLLRQQLLPTDRVHGIVTRGGDAPNIIPAHTSALFMVRAHDRTRLDELTQLVSRCFEAGALATGTEVSIVPGAAYSNMIHDPDLAALYRHNAESLGRVFDDSDGSPVSTDMGDVSHLVPSIHPMIGIDCAGAVNHQRAFADACATPSADQAILDAAVAMTWTIIDAAQDEVLRGRLLSEELAREAVALVEVAGELEEEAEILAEAAEALVSSDPEAAEDLALAAILLDSEAAELADAAVERLDEAAAIQDEAVLDQVANELADDAEDLAAGAKDLAAGAWEMTAASEVALDEFADDASVALDAAEEAAGLEAVADTLAEEAVELSVESAELAAEADAFAEQAVAVAASDPDAADDLAATAWVFETRAQETADEAEATFDQALEIAADAAVAEDLAEVATEAAEDAAAEAIEDVVIAEVLAGEAGETADLAEVVTEAAEDAAALVPQLPVITTHASWDEEFARMLGDTSDEAAAASAPAGDSWYTRPPEPELDAADATEPTAEDDPTDATEPTAEDDPTDATEPTAEDEPVTEEAPETPLGDFEWIPGSPG